MGEAKQKRLNGRPLGLVSVNGLPLRAEPKGPPPATLRLIATRAEIGAASYLVDFCGTMGIPRYRAQTSAIAYTTKVPVAKLVGEVVEVIQVEDGTPIPDRLIKLRPGKPEPASPAAVAEAERVLGPMVPAAPVDVAAASIEAEVEELQPKKVC